MKINDEFIYTNNEVYRFIAVAHSKQHIMMDFIFNGFEGIVIKIKGTKKERDNFLERI